MPIGRMTRQMPSSQRPEVFVETGGDIAATAAHPMWQLPSTFGIVRFDSRRERNPITGMETFTDINPAANYWGNQLSLVVGIYTDRFSATFADGNKPLRFAFMFVGPDEANTNKFITRDPTDGYPGGIGKSILFRVNGPANTRTWCQTAFASAAQSLVSAGLPMPSVFLTDLDTAGSVSDSQPYNAASPPPAGYFEPALSDDNQLARSLAASKSLDQFLQGCDRVLSGQTWDPYAPNSSPAPLDRTLPLVSPTNFERTGLVDAVNIANYGAAMDYAIFQPARAAFTGIQCGEWRLTANSQEHPSLFQPKWAQHFGQGYMPADVQVVANYMDPPSWGLRKQSEADVYPPASAWSTYNSWLAAYPQVGPSPPSVPATELITDAAIVSEQWQRMCMETRTLEARAARDAAPDKPLFTCVSLCPAQTSITLDQLRENAIPMMARYMLNTVDLGAIGFWIFAPSWNTDSVTRDAHTELVKTFQGLFNARQPRRNRVRRFA